MPRLTVTQADITRAIRAAENAGWARGAFKVVVEGAAITLLPVGGAVDEADDIERRMNEAFASDHRAPALRPS